MFPLKIRVEWGYKVGWGKDGNSRWLSIFPKRGGRPIVRFEIGHERAEIRWGNW